VKECLPAAATSKDLVAAAGVLVLALVWLLVIVLVLVLRAVTVVMAAWA
jgi:hypothetical protein